MLFYTNYFELILIWHMDVVTLKSTNLSTLSSAERLTFDRVKFIARIIVPSTSLSLIDVYAYAPWIGNMNETQFRPFVLLIQNVKKILN